MKKTKDEIILSTKRMFTTTERNNIINIWREVADYITPSQSGFYNEDNVLGQRKTDHIFDITAIQSNRDLASAIQSTVVNPATKWAKLKFEDEKLNDSDEHSQWLLQTSNRIHREINNSNFNAQMSKAFQNYCSIGTMALLCEEIINNQGQYEGLYFKSIHMSEIAFEENYLGIVDRIARKYRLTPRTLYEKYGNILPSDYFDEIDLDNTEDRIEVIHVVFPNPDEIKINAKTGRALPKHRPFVSYLFENRNGNILEEDGYYEMPYIITRWETLTNEVYGRSPSFTALPIVKMLNQLQSTSIQMVSRNLKPPMMVKNGNMLTKLNLGMGKVNIVRELDGIRELLSNSRIDLGQFKIEELQKLIEKIYYLDKLLLPPRQETGEMTAYEVQQRLEQMQKVLGSVLGNINNEFLSPLVMRVYKILERNGIINPINLQGNNINVQFENSLARSQRNEDITNILQWVNYTMQVAQIKPEALDLINADEIIKLMADIRNIPDGVINSDEMVAQMREQRQQQQQMAQAMEMATKQADIQSKSKPESVE